MTETNRIEEMTAIVQTRIDQLDMSQVAALDAKTAIDFDEHFRYQQAQSQAHAAGLLTRGEAQLVYAALGENGSDRNGGWAAETPLATKVVVTTLIGELLLARVL